MGKNTKLVERKVKGLLNKLTTEAFDSISDQIIAWANKSEKEKDGRTLIQVIRLVFEKATDEATWSEMYARLCRKMMEQIRTIVQDDDIENAEGKPISGGQIFRKYLLNRCQEDFERGWVVKEATAAAAATKALEDEAAKAANAKAKEDGTEEIVLYSDEYYADQKAKRQGLGLIKFIGELFKLQMITDRIMHECVKKLLANVDNPEEEEIESLCTLLTTVGSMLDTQGARVHMDVYFSRIKELMKSSNVTFRMQFMLQDLLELRERKWVAHNAVAASTTIAQFHENTAQEKESHQRQISMSQGSVFAGKNTEEETSIEMTEEAALKKIGEDLKQFFAVRNLEEAVVYFSSLPHHHHHILVNKIVSIAVKSKEDDAKLVSQFFVLAASKELCSASSFEEGLTPVAEIIDDIAIDVPKAFQLLAMMVKGASLDQERLSNLASKSLDSDKFLALLESTAQTVCSGPRLNLAPVGIDQPWQKKLDLFLATSSGELGEALPSHQSPYGSTGSPSANLSTPPSATSLSSHASGSGRKSRNYEAERLQILLNASQEDLRLRQRQFDEEKIIMNRYFEKRQQNQQLQFGAERMLYQSQIEALSGYRTSSGKSRRHRK